MRILYKKKSSSALRPSRYPPEAAGIQVNYCKNPKCANFGVPPHPQKAYRRKSITPAGPGDYTVVASGKGQPVLRCELCFEHIPMQSNLAIAEELLRISGYLEPPAEPSCPNELCEAHGVPLSTAPKGYRRYGTNARGTPRYRCNSCHKVFALAAKSTHWQHETHFNRDVFEHLVNSVPLRRIIKILGITPGVLYRRMEFIWRQCCEFAGERERGLLDRQDLGRRYIAMDRQALMVNWETRKDRRNTLLLLCASADLETGYVFGAHLNYDANADADEVIANLPRFGDNHLPQPFRRYARLWLPQDYEDAARRGGNAKGETGGDFSGLQAEIDAAYAEALQRQNIEAGPGPKAHTRTPLRGMQVHEQVTMAAHVQFVARLLHRAEKIRFFMDQESGLRAAFMTAFARRVRDRTADAFFVRVLKGATVDIKRKLVRQAQQRFAKAQLRYSGLSDNEVEIALIREEMERMASIGKWGDRWLTHPFPDMREPEKQVCWLTDIENPETDPSLREDQLNHAAYLYRKASLHAVDRFFMQVRRGVTMAERGVVSSSADRRLWFGKNAYNPANLAMMLEIYRTYFNYCEVGSDGKTPAMRLGLAKGPVASEDILYFVRTKGGSL